jgi:hypothetical protein
MKDDSDKPFKINYSSSTMFFFHLHYTNVRIKTEGKS